MAMLLGVAGCATGSTAAADGGLTVEGPDGSLIVPRDAGHGVIIIGAGDTGGTIGNGNGVGTGPGTSAGADGGCPGSLVACNGVCTDTTSDPSNCGACAQTCGGATCVDSLCSAVAGGCSAGQTMCVAACTDTTTDPFNCGSCSNVCMSGTCVSGQCGSSGGGGGGGGCAHSPCTTGSALQPGCDDSVDGLVTFVCMDLPQCCSSSWTSDCVMDAESYCIDPFNGQDVCMDPSC